MYPFHLIIEPSLHFYKVHFHVTSLSSWDGRSITLKGNSGCLETRRSQFQSRPWGERCGEPVPCAHLGCTEQTMRREVWWTRALCPFGVYIWEGPPDVAFCSGSASVGTGCIIFTSNDNVWFHVLTRLHNFRTESLIFSQKRKILERWRGEKNTKTETSSQFLKNLIHKVFGGHYLIIFSGFGREI